MKFDRTTLTVIIICVMALMSWPFLFPYGKQAETPAAAPAPASEATKASSSQAAEKPQAAAEAALPAAAAPQGSSEKLPVLPEIVLQNSVASFVLNPNKGEITAVTLKQFKTADRKADIVIGAPNSQENVFALLGLDSWTLVKAEAKAASAASTAASVSRQFRKGSETIGVTELFELGDSYLLKCSLEFKNLSSEAIKLPDVSVSAGGLPPLHWLSGDSVYTDPHRVDFCFSNNKHVRTFDPSVSDEKFKVEQTFNSLDWVGSSNKYFATMLVPQGSAFNGGNLISRVQREGEQNGSKATYFVPNIAGTLKGVELAPGAKASYLFDYYAGPKEMGFLKKQLPETALEILHISYWSWFEPLARPLLWLLNWLKDYCGSYGLSIILLTLIVRIVFWPATQKANKSMRRMQKIQPKVQELREKYKSDSQTMNMKMMELYKKEKVNPLGGCLPLLLQLPVFFALYSTLDAAVELRQVSFLWAADLSKPDLIGPPLIFGIGLHPLILIMTALMVVQQKMTPMMGDPLQHKMMMAMPLIMLVMLYNLPSGLTLYWTVSNAFSIAQLQYNLYVNKREDAMEALKSKNA